MTPFAEGIWVDIAPVRILGMRLTTTITVLPLHDGSLLLHSPLPLTAERRAAVEALGLVAHLYAPRRYHDLRIGERAAAFPAARLHAPSGLVKERSDLRIHRVIGSAPEPAFSRRCR
jgi:hypothetical protein